MDYETANRLFLYDKDTGVLRWKVDRGTAVKSGSIAGSTMNKGYTAIETGGKGYLAHRIAFLLTEGYMPEHEIDHINGVRTDNRWSNLRHVTSYCNNQNKKMNKNNSSGVRGVYFKNGKYYEVLGMLRYSKTYLGAYKTKLEAALARYTWENSCPLWQCNHKSDTVDAILLMWPDFQKCLKT